jgi:hypothetical protein
MKADIENTQQWLILRRVFCMFRHYLENSVRLAKARLAAVDPEPYQLFVRLVLSLQSIPTFAPNF